MHLTVFFGVFITVHFNQALINKTVDLIKLYSQPHRLLPKSLQSHPQFFPHPNFP